MAAAAAAPSASRRISRALRHADRLWRRLHCGLGGDHHRQPERSGQGAAHPSLSGFDAPAVAAFGRWAAALSAVPSDGVARKTTTMCRNIKTLFNFEPPATEAEIRASSLQFVRKLSGFNAPSRANQAAFDRAVEQVADAVRELIDALITSAEPRDRDVEAERARARSAARSDTAT